MVERRQVPRYFFTGEAHLVFPGDGPTAEISLNSLSVQGCRAEGKDLPGVGDKCELHLHWEGKEFQAKAEVTWKNAKAQIGLRFLSMDEPDLKLLRKLCSQLQIQPLTVLPTDPDRIPH